MKTALITGASTGIGEACALTLAQRGWRVFSGVRQPEDGERLRRAGGARLFPVLLDVTDAQQIAAAVELVRAETGDAGLTGLINNAGVAVPAPVEIVPIDALRHQFEVNTVGPVALTQAFLPLLRQSQRPATIVNISSVSGRIALPGIGAYAASKFALEALSDSLRVELRPWGIRMVLVEPGTIATPIWRKTISAARSMLDTIPTEQRRPYQPLIDYLISRIDPDQGITPQQVADTVITALTHPRPRARYLVGPNARLTTWIDRGPTRLRDWLIARQLPKYGD